MIAIRFSMPISRTCITFEALKPPEWPDLLGMLTMMMFALFQKHGDMTKPGLMVPNQMQ